MPRRSTSCWSRSAAAAEAYARDLEEHVKLHIERAAISEEYALSLQAELQRITGTA